MKSVTHKRSVDSLTVVRARETKERERRCPVYKCYTESNQNRADLSDLTNHCAELTLCHASSQVSMQGSSTKGTRSTRRLLILLKTFFPLVCLQQRMRSYHASSQKAQQIRFPEITSSKCIRIRREARSPRIKSSVQSSIVQVDQQRRMTQLRLRITLR